MESFLINGKNKVSGSLTVECSKNAILPILAGCILVNGQVKLNNVTYYEDVLNMLEILKHLGVKVLQNTNELILNCKNIKSSIIPNVLTNKLRASFFCLGPLFARTGFSKVAYPGGCSIGTRPIDLHIKGLNALGINVIDKHGYVTASGKVKSGKIMLDFPSVGATENLIMASVTALGVVEIYGVAKEPEVVDLCNFLNSCGAKIYGAGTDKIVVQGVNSLHGTEYSPISDRIIAGSYMMLPLVCGGEIEIHNVNTDHILPILNILKNNSCNIRQKNDILTIGCNKRIKGFGKIETLPYPYFPTDLQQIFCAVACKANGTSILIENMFEDRFKHVSELIKMGAKITVKDNTCVVVGVKELYGAEVEAKDLRGGMSLVLAGLGANGYTTINGVQFIDRGYYKLENSLTKVGLNVKRITS